MPPPEVFLCFATSMKGPGRHRSQFLVKMIICRTIYNMCTQKPPHDYSEQLYNRYKEAFNGYINDKVTGMSYPGDSHGNAS